MAARTGEIKSSSLFVKEATRRNLNLTVSDDKLKEVTKLYLQGKGMSVDANELEFSDSDHSCYGPQGHDPFKCKYGAKHLGIKGKADWRKRIQHYSKVKNRQQSSV